MRQLMTVLLIVICTSDGDAKQTLRVPGRRAGVSGLIYGGQEADPGAWPWQLSLQKFNGVDWVHSCGAALLSATKALTTGRTVDGSIASSLRVVGGLHNPTDLTNTQISNVAYYVIHERYLADSAATLSNDIAMLNLATPITTSSTVQFLTLPANNNDAFDGSVCTVTGWGCYSSSCSLPSGLLQAEMEVITVSECQMLLSTGGGNVWENQVCGYDRQQKVGLCQYDQGGPLNCPDGSGGYIVVGIGSWHISSPEGECLQTYPSVFTRTSAYLDWINSNS